MRSDRLSIKSDDAAPMKPFMAQNDSISKLTPRQLVALECLMTRTEDETVEEVGSRAGVSRRTMHRYLRDATFHAEYRSRVAMEIGSQRWRMAAALVKGATTPGPGQAAMQKIYWTMLGELKDAVDLTVAGSVGVDVNTAFPEMNLDALTLTEKIEFTRLLQKVGILPASDPWEREMLEGFALAETNEDTALVRVSTSPTNPRTNVVPRTNGHDLSRDLDGKTLDGWANLRLVSNEPPAIEAGDGDYEVL